MAFRNYMEDIVLRNLEDILNEVEGVCKCERCREDIVAWVLNRLSPKYVVTSLGSVYMEIEQLEIQMKTDVTVLLLQAAEKIRAHPMH